MTLAIGMDFGGDAPMINAMHVSHHQGWDGRAPKRRREADSSRPEYDFSGGTRGKYAYRFRKGTNVVVLDPDIARRFRTELEVNKALRWFLATRSGKAGGRR